MAHRGKTRQKVRLKAKRLRKMLMGKNVPFNLQNCPKKLYGISNRYCYKTNIHRLIYKGARFKNVKYQASNITACNFKNSILNGVDFVGCNLKDCNFSGAILSNVVFVNCLMDKTCFRNCHFENVYFVTTDISGCIDLPDDYMSLSTYPNIKLESDMLEALVRLSHTEESYKYHVLHVKKTKPNMWFVQILINRFGDSAGRALLVLSKKEKLYGLYTLSAYINFIEKYLEV